MGQTGPRPRGRPLALAAAGIGIAVTIVAGVVVFARTGPPAPSSGGAVISAEVLGGLRGDGKVRLADYAGKPVVVNFFASWCTFCIVEMPDFQKVHAAVGDDVSFLGVAMNDVPEAAIRLVEATGVTYDLADDPEGAFFERVGATGMPTTLFVDGEGRVLERFSGPLSLDALRNRIDKHFG